MEKQKYEVGQRVKNVETFRSIHTKEIVSREKSGTVLEVAQPGEKITGTSKGLEIRYRIKWDNAPRTWMRESALLPA